MDETEFLVSPDWTVYLDGMGWTESRALRV
jgi:hypothetical protein